MLTLPARSPCSTNRKRLPARVLCLALSIGAAAALMACSDNENSVQDDASPPSNTAGSGQAHSGACKGCGALLRGEIVSPSQVCGFQGHGVAGEPLCAPDTACERFADVYACSCGDGDALGGACNDPARNNSCATTACLSATPSAACRECIMTTCTEQVGACMQSM